MAVLRIAQITVGVALLLIHQSVMSVLPLFIKKLLAQCMAFCDWFSGFVNLDLDYLHDGRIIQIRSTGEIDFETLKPLTVTGSYDDKVIIKSCVIPAAPEWSLLKHDGSIYRVYISGNPTKFLQGHNVYGHSDMVAVIRDFIRLVLQKIDVDEFTIARCLRDPIKCTRFDITQSYLMDSPKDVSDWLRASSQYITGKNQKVDNDKTLYVGKNSRRCSIKVYEKAAEMLKHKSTFNLPEASFDALYKTASLLLRFEVTLRGMKLEDLQMHYLQKVDNKMLEEQFSLQIQKMNLPENIELIENDIHQLSDRYAGVYLKWLEGVDIKKQMKLSTYKRYLKFFLDSYHLDLSMPPRDISKTNVIPLWRVISVEREFNPSENDEFLYVPISSSK